MAIRQSKYIDITSGVGGASAVGNREFIARCFTSNPNVGIGHILEFTDLDSVLRYFGNTSKEYLFAEKYFGFISKSITRAQKISFARLGNSESETKAYLLGLTSPNDSIQSYKNSNKTITFVFGDQTTTVSNINFDSANDITSVLNAIQTALKEKPGHGTDTVELDDNGKVRVTFGAITTSEIKPCPATDGTIDLATILGLTKGTGVVCSNYAPVESVTESCARIDAINDNCGSIVFLDAIESADAKSVARWNDSKNYKYLLVLNGIAYTNTLGLLEDANGTVSLSKDLSEVTGTTIYVGKANSNIAALPAALFATTDYRRTNATKTFMFQQGDFSADITSDISANALDSANINYMGQTQFAGGLLDFSQDGVNTNGDETSVYCNEVWMKSSLWADFMNLFLAVEKVPANEDGKNMLRTVMMNTVETAIRNGTIIKAKELTTTQKVYISQITGDSEAWKQVQSEGFVLQINIELDENTKKYVAKYILVYSKGDSIRKVVGTDILI